MVVVLPEPLTPTTRMTNGFFAASMASGCATGGEHLLDFRGHHGLDFVRRDRRVVAAFAQRRGDAGRGIEAEIGADQRVLDLAQWSLRRACAW